ncbi:MAG TPA: PAS domain S-box protein [Verrucomicrobiae bacterium]|nr:PAS domain S-box protein [Verrucomicrobiae bacterium]
MSEVKLTRPAANLGKSSAETNGFLANSEIESSHDHCDAGGRDHFVQFYEDQEGLADSVAKFIGAGLGAGEAAVVIATPAHRKAIAGRLTSNGLDLAALEARGNYVALDAAGVMAKFLVNGAPDQARFKKVVGRLVQKAGKGRPGLRAFGEMVALLWADGNSPAAIRLEELWNDLGKEHVFSLFCAYPLDDFTKTVDGDGLRKICEKHSHVLPSERYFSRDEQGRLREIAMLQQKARALETEVDERKRAEETLRESEQRLRATFNQAAVGIALASLDGCFVEMNQKFAELFGYSKDELCRITVSDITHPDDRPRTREKMARLINGEISNYSYETRFVRKDGAVIWTLATITAIKDGLGTPLRLIGVVQDITGRKHAEESLAVRARQQRAVAELGIAALKQSELQKLFDYAVGVVARTLDVPYCKVLELLPEQQAVLLRSGVGWKDGLVGQATVSIGRDSQAGFTLLSNEPVVVEDLRTETRFNGPSLLHEHGVISGMSCIIMGEPGRSWGVIGTHTTERRVFTEDDVAFLQAIANVLASSIQNKKSQQGAARLAAIVEHSDDAIFSVDLDGIIRSWNRGAERLFRYFEKEAVGQPINILIPNGRDDEEPGILNRIRAGEAIENFETVRCRKDGTPLNISLTVSPIKDARGNITGASKVARDITDKVRAREILERTVSERTASLREAVEQMEEFSYSVSHDLRAPLRAMHAYAGVLLEDYGNHLDDIARGYLQKIQRSTDRMNRLTQDVLAYSRIARSHVQPERVELERLVRDVIYQHTSLQPPAADIEIVDPLPAVLGHEITLGQCVSNLLNNGVKFVASGVKPRVRIRSERAGKNVRVWFEDNGIGVNPEHQQRIFNMFEQVHPPGKFEGTGIGLTIVRKAMEKMGGKVGVESDGVNGSRFWIELRYCD